MKLVANDLGVEVQLVTGLLARAPVQADVAWQAGDVVIARSPRAAMTRIPLPAGQRLQVDRFTITSVSEVGELAVFAVAAAATRAPGRVVRLVQPDPRPGCATVLREFDGLLRGGDLSALAVLGLLTGRRTLVRVSSDSGLESAALAGLGAALAARLGAV